MSATTRQSGTRQTSLSAFAWRELVGSRAAWGPWYVGIVAVPSAVTIVMPMPAGFHPDPTQHDLSLLLGNLLHNLLPMVCYLLLMASLSLASSYIFMVVYLKYAVQADAPEFSVKSFLRWLGYDLWRAYRPILWMLIPVVGWFFYARSVTRRVTATPMALFGETEIMRRSWNLSRGHAWRIFWNVVKLDAPFALAGFILTVATMGTSLAVMHGAQDTSSQGWDAITTIIGCLMSRGILLVNAIYSCVVYRVLQQEKAAMPANTVVGQ